MEFRAPLDSEKPLVWALFKEAFQDDDKFINFFFDTAYSKERARIASIDGEIASMLYWFDCEYSKKKVAYLYAIATDKRFRGKGICSALMNDTHKYLLKMGYSCAILKPASASLFDFYGKIGYQMGTYLNQFNVKKATQGCQFSEIDVFEYASLRRKYLPEKSVLQNGVSLDFLKGLSKFIKGEGFIMAYSLYGDKLIAHEMLGNLSMAGEVLYSLGVESGTIRSIGNEMPFTMIYPFSSDFIFPEYFGFAFD